MLHRELNEFLLVGLQAPRATLRRPHGRAPGRIDLLPERRCRRRRVLGTGDATGHVDEQARAITADSGGNRGLEIPALGPNAW